MRRSDVEDAVIKGSSAMVEPFFIVKYPNANILGVFGDDR